MGFAILLVYLFVAYWGLVGLIPGLASFRPMLVLAALGVVISLAAGAIGRRRPSFRTPHLYFMLGFTGAIAVSRIMTGWIGGAVGALSSFAPSIAVFIMVVFSVNSLRRMRILTALLVLMMLALVGQGFAAYQFGLNAETFVYHQRELRGDEADDADAPRDTEGHLVRRIRGLGFLNDPNDLAQALLIALPFVGIAWRTRAYARNLFLVLLPGSVLVFGLYLTHSRGGIVGLLALVLLAFRRRLGRVTAVVLTSLAGVAAAALNFSGGRAVTGDASASSRVAAWAAGLVMFKSSPIWGVGFGAFADLHERAAHNSMVNCLAELGLLGYFFWAGLILASLLGVSTLASECDAADPEHVALGAWARAIGLSLQVFLVSAFFLSRTYTMTLYMLCGLGVAVLDIAKREGIEPRPASAAIWTLRIAAVEMASVVALYMTVRVYGMTGR